MCENVKCARVARDDMARYGLNCFDRIEDTTGETRQQRRGC